MFELTSTKKGMLRGYLAVFGGNDLACPAISHLKSLGYKVLVVDGNSTSPARQIADVFINSDFSDVPGTMEKLRDFNFIGVIALNDFAVRAAARLSSERLLPGWNEVSVHSLTNKIALKRRWVEKGIPTASFTSGRVEDAINGHFPQWDLWPCVVKPSFSGGGSRGVFLARSQQELLSGIIQRAESFLDGEYLLEEFVKGVEHTIEVIVVNNQSKIISISDKQNYSESMSVVQTLIFPGPIGQKYRKRLNQLVQMACESINLSNGAAHFEVISNANDITFLEVGGRPGGGINFHPICLLSTGFDYPRILAEVLTRQRVNLNRTMRVRRKLVWTYFDAGFGQLKAIDGLELLRQKSYVIMFRVYEQIGQLRMDLIDDLHRPGFVLIQGWSISSTLRRAKRLVSKIKFVTD